jgi:hypothetical protein
MSPANARALLDVNFLDSAVEIVALDSEAYRRLLQSVPDRGVAGGHVYDTVILTCGLIGQVDELLTFNESHFRSLESGGIDIVVPT